MHTTPTFEGLFRTEYPRLVSLGATMGVPRDVAAELAQEAMLRAHRRWNDLAEYDAPQAWLRRVMVNLVIDHHRSRRSERRAVERLATNADATVEPPALEEWSRLVADLPARQLAVVTLYYADDRSTDEIADLLDVSPGTVKTTLFKARQALANRLANATDRDADEGDRHVG